MLMLYHGTTSVCAIKVRLTLAEKNLEHENHLINLQKLEQYDPEYLKLNPNGVVPTLVHDDQVVIESSLICAYLDETFPERACMPGDPAGRFRARLWMKKVDEGMHAAVNVLTFATANRKGWVDKTQDEREAYYARIQDPAGRERRRQTVELGMDAPVVVDAIRHYDKRLGEMEAALADGPYLAGENWTLGDAAVTPYVNRLDMLGLAAMWEGRGRPRVGEWLARVRARPSFGPAITDWFGAAEAERYAPDGQDVVGRMKAILAA